MVEGSPDVPSEPFPLSGLVPHPCVPVRVRGLEGGRNCLFSLAAGWLPPLTFLSRHPNLLCQLCPLGVGVTGRKPQGLPLGESVGGKSCYFEAM